MTVHKSFRIAALATVCLAGVLPATAQKRDLSQGNTMYLVPYAHLDTQWRWAYPQVIREYIANTLHDNFKLIEKYPNYVFNFSGSRRYEMMKEYYPEEYKQLKAYVKAGRWFPCGSSVDENDANVPSGESQLRHVLYGNDFFRKEFGTASSEFMLPDCFGFPYALPSILAHCGLNGFSTQKLTWGSAVGIPFKVGRWIGPDGRGVVAALDPGAYVGVVDEDLSENTSWLARIQNTGKMSGAYVDYHYYGTGDTGGAPRESSVQWVEKSIAGKGPITVVSTRSDAMFNALTPGQIAKLPSYQGELLLTEHSAGSITSQAYMKRWNRKNELLADAAERASVAAMWLGGANYPSKRLYDAWDLVLGTQMHDMLPGTSIPKAYEFCWNDYLLALNNFAAITTDAVGSVSSMMDTRGRGTPLVVYNPLSVERTDVVEATVPIGSRHGLQVYGPDGKAVPTQVLSTDAAGTHIIFLAKAPANGFASYNVAESRGGFAVRTKLPIIENENLRVTINKLGDIGSVYDKVNKREILKSASRLSFTYHNPSAFPAWNMDWADAKNPPRGYVDGPATFKVVESGPVRQTIEVTRQARGSKFVQRISLTAGENQVNVDNKIDWQTPQMALKAEFPLTTGNPKATYDLQLGAIERGNNDPKKYEVPQHQWLDLTKPDGSYGVGILNDSKFGSDKPDSDTVRLTLLYTPGVRSGYNDQWNQDFGRHDISYAIAPHKGNWQAGNVPWRAKRFNQPLRAFVVPSHSGSLGKSFSLLSANSNLVEVQALKKAENSNEIIVRLRGLTPKAANGVAVSAAVPIASAREVNGQEGPIGSATVRDGKLIANVPGYSLKTYAIRLASPKRTAAPAASQAIKLPMDADVVSFDGNRKDGKFDSDGRTLAAEQLPNSIETDGIRFNLGPKADGAKNAVTARGQKIQIPAGYDRVFLLAASAKGDRKVSFGIGNRQAPATIRDWGGYVGSWDNRLWVGDLGPNFTNYGEWGGLVPGYVNPEEVAWYSSHRHHPTAGNEYYQYSYLFKYGFDVPAGARTITLPNDSNVKILAISVAKNTNDAVRPAAALYDTMADHQFGGRPMISPSKGPFKDRTVVTITPPLYWRKGSLHYTTDGRIPDKNAPVYTGPLSLSDAEMISVAEVDPSGMIGFVSTAKLNIRDTTAPRVTSVTAAPEFGTARVRFSEPVSKDSAEKTANYRFSGGATITSARLSEDGQSVNLAISGTNAQVGSLTVSGVTDMSKSRNAVAGAPSPVAIKGAVVSQATFEKAKTQVIDSAKLPVKARDTWTVNFFCKIDSQPPSRTVIAGFGSADAGEGGVGRYFTKFQRGINFWIDNRDVMTNVPLDTGKWQMLTATYDGRTVRVYKNGVQIGQREVELGDDPVSKAQIMPLDPWEHQRMFQGEVRDFTIWDFDLSGDAIKNLYSRGQ